MNLESFADPCEQHQQVACMELVGHVWFNNVKGFGRRYDVYALCKRYVEEGAGYAFVEHHI